MIRICFLSSTQIEREEQRGQEGGCGGGVHCWRGIASSCCCCCKSGVRRGVLLLWIKHCSFATCACFGNITGMFTATKVFKKKNSSLISALDYFNAGLIPQTHSVCITRKKWTKIRFVDFFWTPYVAFCSNFAFIDTSLWRQLKELLQTPKEFFCFLYYKIKFYFYDLVKLTIVLAYILQITPILITANGKTIS